MRSLSCLLIALHIFGAWQCALGQAISWEGRSLSDYLDALNDSGLRIIFSSDLVHDNMRMAAEPGVVTTPSDLSDVLRPFGLAAEPGPGESILVTRETPPPVNEMAAAEPVPEPEPIPEVVVTSSLHRLDYTTPSTHTYLDRELATRIPLTGDEAVRLTHRLPGSASGGVSSKNHVRGGEVNEVLFLFDGLRLYEPYHLKDFQAVSTIINSNAIGGMDFYSGAYPARYGDRMSGVLNIEIREPEKRLETELALSFFHASALSLGTFGDEQQGEWLLSARRGNLDLIADVVDPEVGNPDYQDYLAHLAWEFGPRSRLSANFLLSDDKLRLFDPDRGEEARATYSNQVFWAKWQADWSAVLASDTILAISDITDRRNGALDLPGIVSGELADYGDFRARELRQDWRLTPSDRWMLRFGFNLKDLDATYRFISTKVVMAPFDSIFDNQPASSLDLDVMPAGNQYAAYTELRWRPITNLTMDVGLRWDQQTYTTANDDTQLSPRVGILYQPGERSEIRLGWGQYHQAQEINELQISDGVTTYFPAQRAEHVVLNARHLFRSGIDLGITIYRKSFRRVRPRFENSLNTLTLLPELQFDRIRVDAATADAVGAELMLTRGSASEDLLWWLGYAWSEVEDQTATGAVRRSWDQTHTVKAGLSWRWQPWNFSLAGEVHTGWPRTLLSGVLADSPGGGQDLELDVSDPNAYRYSVFHTLDLRISRDFDVRRGNLTTFLEITNLYNRANPCCTEYSLNADGSLASREAHWLPLVPSLGIVWQF